MYSNHLFLCQQVVLILGTQLLAGCGGSNRQQIEGTVTLDGQPLSEGQVIFMPMQVTRGPTAGGKIENGTYSISDDKGTFAGKFRVEISASRKTGRKIKTPRGELIDEVANYIPPRFNKNSELTAEVKADELNWFDFSLQSK